MITSGLDYRNALLYGLPDSLINKLWCIQKSAARLITMTDKHEHITPVIKKLHWLPIKQRIEYKILLLTYKSLHGQASAYLTDLLQKRSDRGSRMDNQNRLIVPLIKRDSFGGRTFSRASPMLWNCLPVNLRLCNSLEQFKTRVKTHLVQGVVMLVIYICICSCCLILSNVCIQIVSFYPYHV